MKKIMERNDYHQIQAAQDKDRVGMSLEIYDENQKFIDVDDH